MIKKVKRKPENSRCHRCLANRTDYISDQEHPHHKLKKVVLAAVNFGCFWGKSAKEFIKATHQAFELGKVRIANQKGGGNPNEEIFFEIVYSAPEWLITTAEERAAIDKLITAPFKNCPIRRGWHLAAWDLEEAERPEKWKPLDDAHYLISARDRFGNATISSRFGGGKETFESWRRRIDEEICDMLNRSRAIACEPVHVIHRRRLGTKLGVKLTRLHELIAHHTAEPVTRENLANVVEAMERSAVKEPGKMVPVAKVTNKDRSLADDKLVWVHFTDRLKPRRYRIKKLLLDISETQLDIELDRPDGNDGEEGGAGGESGGGTGGLGGVAPAAAQSGSPEPAPARSVPASPEEGAMVSRPDPLPAVSKSVSVPLDAATPVKHAPAQSTPKSAAVKPEPTPAAPGPVPSLPVSIPPSSSESVPASDESAKPQDASLPPVQPDQPVRQPGPMPATPSPGKSRWRPNPQLNQEDEEQEMS